MFATMTNRGAQIALVPTQVEAQKVADAVNARNSDVFAWVIPAPAGARQEDMPGRGVIYG